METAIISRSKGRFFVFDLLMCSLWALFVLRLWTGSVMTALCVDHPLFDWWTAPIVGYFVVLRLGVSFLILREDKHGIWASLVLLLGGYMSFKLSGFVLIDAIRDEFNYFNMASGWLFNPIMQWVGHLLPFESYKEVIDATWGVFLFCWIWLMPFVYFIIRRKKLVSTRDRIITVLLGVNLFKDPIGKKYLSVCVFFLIAFIIGTVMSSILSLIGLLVLTFVFFRILEKRENRTLKRYEWIYMVFVVFAVWLAQYQTGAIRIVLLTVGVLLTFLLVIKISKGPIFWRAIMVIVVGMILPSLCLGYNVFAMTDCKRMEKLHAKYNLTGVLKVQDSQGRIGLRDRYRMIIPAQYSEIEDYHLPYLKVKKDSLWGIWNTQYAGFVKGDYDHVIVGVDYNNSSYEDLCFQVKPAFAFIEPLGDNMESFRFKRNAADTTTSLGKLFPE